MVWSLTSFLKIAIAEEVDCSLSSEQRPTVRGPPYTLPLPRAHFMVLAAVRPMSERTEEEERAVERRLNALLALCD